MRVRQAALGTLLFCTTRLDAEMHAALLTELDAAAETFEDVRIGIGRPRYGGVAVRILGSGTWHVRAALHALRRIVLAHAGHAEPRTLPLLTS